jgi:hypothetical protein
MVLVGNQVFLISFNHEGSNIKGKSKIPLIIGWSCMLLGFGFHEITAMSPSRHRVIILMEF